MNKELSIRAFIPARDMDASRCFHKDLGFRVLYISDPTGVLWHIAEYS
ncbi:MAG: hypothetical protein ABI616_04285 [Pseudomonadota bacterium]